MGLPPQLNLLRPLLLLSYSASYIPITILRLLTSSPSKLLSWSSFQHAWFGNFWSWFGGVSRESAAATVSPLVRANVSGVVLDIGPGSGEWVYLYAATATKSPKSMEVEAAGLKGIYEILPVGAQDLRSVGLEPESIDTIVTLQTLCSCPGPQDIIKSLYPCLKKGGTWLVYEHVKTKYSSEFVGYWQPFINLLWPTFFDGCDITRPTDKWLREAGDWEEVSLREGEGEGPYDTIPHSLGTLIKHR
ncbi:S-adenosyl-L-methionine-dependent methyltransferase [Aureobasidium subglaciale]|nr:S-adenosyl-L-methionine-dependent methyltransferase [Aureobasidium subglaciale]